MFMESVKEFNEKREMGNAKINSEDFLPYKRFMALDSRAYNNGAIPEKYKELMGLVGSMVLRCNDCIYYHIIECVKCGCSSDEINEAANIALIIGGSIVIPHLRFALSALEEARKEQIISEE
jgi:AhpD family alkylhydroperoxidase